MILSCVSPSSDYSAITLLGNGYIRMHLAGGQRFDNKTLVSSETPVPTVSEISFISECFHFIPHTIFFNTICTNTHIIEFEFVECV